MGYQERDYYRDERMGGAFPIQSAVIGVIVVNVALFLLDKLFGGQHHTVTHALEMHSETIVRPWDWWQFLTAGFVHSPTDPRHIIFNMLGLYFLGLSVEERLGRWEFLRYYLAAIIVSSAIWCGATYLRVGPGATALGASGGVTATVVLFCLLYPRQTLLLFMVIPVPAWVVGVLVVGMDLLGQLGVRGDAPIAFEAHLGGALFAWAYWYFRLSLGRLLGGAWWSQTMRRTARQFRPRPPLRMHDPEEDEQEEDDEREAQLDAEADRILQKIHQHGEASLTSRERRVLEEYSRKLRRQKRP